MRVPAPACGGPCDRPLVVLSGLLVSLLSLALTAAKTIDIVREIQGDTAVTYVHGSDLDEPLARITPSGSAFFLADGLGSIPALTDSTGAPTTSYTYGPFGHTAVAGAATGNVLQYTARENDATGLYYYRSRYYHPGLARFLSEDPLSLASGDLNLYTYVGNNPLLYRDPFGQCKDPGGPGIRYCIDSYIADATVFGIGRFGIGAGDDRGPDSDGGTYRTRQLIRTGQDPENLPGVSFGLRLGSHKLFGKEGSVRDCNARTIPMPLGGRKIIAWCTGINGYNIGDPLQYYFVMRELPDGTAKVVQAYGTPFPSFEVWQYGAPGGPRAVPLYHYDNKAAGTTILDLSRGIGPLPLRR